MWNLYVYETSIIIQRWALMMRFLFFILPLYFFGTENVYNILLLNIFFFVFPVERKKRNAGISIDYLLNGGYT